MTAPTCAPAPLTGPPTPRGPLAVVAAASRLHLDASFRGLFGIRGRFTDVAGYIDVGDDLEGTRMRIDVRAASLTTGSATRDAMLSAAGLIDPDAGPLLRFRPRRIARRGTALVVDGLVGTDRAVAPLRLDVELPLAAPGHRARAAGPRRDRPGHDRRPADPPRRGTHARPDLHAGPDGGAAPGTPDTSHTACAIRTHAAACVRSAHGV